jgi:hypothetical protein
VRIHGRLCCAAWLRSVGSWSSRARRKKTHHIEPLNAVETPNQIVSKNATRTAYLWKIKRSGRSICALSRDKIRNAEVRITAPENAPFPDHSSAPVRKARGGGRSQTREAKKTKQKKSAGTMIHMPFQCWIVIAGFGRARASVRPISKCREVERLSGNCEETIARGEENRKKGNQKAN